MTDRDRLIRLIDGFVFGTQIAVNNIEWDSTKVKELADHLIANGVIVPPCEIGADVWYLSGDVKNGWETLKPTHAEKVSGGFNLKMLNSITGKLAPWYFLTKEEAEKALERS